MLYDRSQPQYLHGRINPISINAFFKTFTVGACPRCQKELSLLLVLWELVQVLSDLSFKALITFCNYYIWQNDPKLVIYLVVNQKSLRNKVSIYFWLKAPWRVVTGLNITLPCYSPPRLLSTNQVRPLFRS